MSNKKNKKKKTVYIDDGRTIVDMSGIGGAASSRGKSPVQSSWKDKLRTYFESCKMMLLPMLLTLGIVSIAFGLLYLLLLLA